MEGNSKPNSAVFITLREVYELLWDTRERLVVVSNDIHWVRDKMNGYDERIESLQTEIKALWAENAKLRSKISDAQVAHSGISATIKTAASIGSLILSLSVAIYVALLPG